MGPYVIGSFVLGCYVMGPFVMGPLVMGPYVGAPLKHHPGLLGTFKISQSSAIVPIRLISWDEIWAFFQ